MNHGDGRCIIRIHQVREKCTQLSYQEHTLIYDGPAGHGGHIGLHITLLELTADHIESPVIIQICRKILSSSQEGLQDHGHAVTGLASQNLRGDGNLTPCQYRRTFLCRDGLEHFPCLADLQITLGKEEHTHAVLPFSRQGHALLCQLLYEKLMRDLGQDAHTVTGLSFCILSCPVLQTLYDLQCVIHQSMALFSLYMNDGSDTAVIMLKGRIIKTIFPKLFISSKFFISRFQHSIFLRLVSK